MRGLSPPQALEKLDRALRPLQSKADGGGCGSGLQLETEEAATGGLEADELENVRQNPGRIREFEIHAIGTGRDASGVAANGDQETGLSLLQLGGAELTCQGQGSHRWWVSLTVTDCQGLKAG